jgi:arylsulfatase A-like enzyme
VSSRSLDPEALETVHHASAVLVGLAVWLGLVTAAAELSALAIQQYVLGTFVQHSDIHLLWMIPVSDMLFSAVPGILLVLAHHRWPRILSVKRVAFLLSVLAYVGVLFIVRRHIHIVAIWLLAIGAAWQTAAYMERHLDGLRRTLRRTLPAMLALVALAIGFVFTIPGITERRGIARLGPTPGGARNVILIILDTVREKSLSLGGSARSTSPMLEEFARTGVAFTNAWSPSNWTPPSHASIFTGQWATEFPDIGLRGMDRAFTTLAEAFRDRGYMTGGFSANRIVNAESGLTRGFLHYEVFTNSLTQLLHAGSLGRAIDRSNTMRRLLGVRDLPGRLSASDNNQRVLRWLDRRPQRPFFLFINYFDAHAPYVPPAPFDTLFDPRGRGRMPALVQQLNAAELPADVVRSERDAYEGSIAFQDTQVGALVNELRERNLFDSTIVVITADHGEEFGEHHGMGHGSTLYSELLQVPLVIVAPGLAPAGAVVDSPVTPADLAATLTGLAGIDGAPFPGGSLAHLWADPTLPADKAHPRMPFATWDDAGAVVIDDFHYIRKADGVEEIYNYRADPDEQSNLVDDSAVVEVLAQARMALEGLMQRPHRPRE